MAQARMMIEAIRRAMTTGCGSRARRSAVLFEGALPVVGGTIAFDAARPGLGLLLRGGEAARHAG